MSTHYEGLTGEEIKAIWMDILDGDDPDEFQTIKPLNDGHIRGSAFSYKQGLHAALKGEGANPAIQDQAFHDGWMRMVWAMRELDIPGLPPSAEKIRSTPAHARGLWTSARVIDPNH